MSPAPNILFIQADQHRHDCIGTNGHPLIQTPNLDRLAQEGANFSRAYCPIPLCTPARASLMTGLWPAQHGCLANAHTEAYHPIHPSLPTFSQALREQGYALAYIGKWDVNRNRPPTEFGFESYLPDTAYLAWRRQQGLPPLPRTNGWFGESDPGIAPEQSSLAWGAQATIRQLQNLTDAGRPFFLRWDPREPHLPNVVPEPFASLYAPEAIEPWPSFPDALANKPYIQRQQRRTWGVEGWSWAQWAPMVARYLGEVTLLDQQVGRILDTLAELGLQDSTLVVYTSDHGDLCGAHGMVDKHYVMYEDVVRVPLILRWPGHIPPGQVVPAFVSSALDLATTFCAVAGAPAPQTFQGRSLLAWATGTAGPEREDIFATYHGNQFGLFSQRMVRDGRWKYVWNPTDVDELYDLDADPGELANLAGENGSKAELERLRMRMVDWMEQTQDRLLNPWTRLQLTSGRKL